MKQKIRTSLLSGAGLLALALSMPSQASYSWTFTGSGTVCPAGVCTESSTSGSTTITATATGWATSSDDVGSSLTPAYQLKKWDGLSVKAPSGEGGTPQHATDNDGRFESVLLSFDKAIALTNVTMGWHWDADFSLLRYADVGVPTLAGNSYADLNTTEGWELVDNYYYSGCGSSCSGTDKNVNSDYDNGPLNSGNATSSYWLIAALNTAYHGGSTSYIGNDYFKIKTLAGTYTPPGNGVPEPASMALMAIGFTAFGFTRRRKQA
jgi:hypothetical protein